MFTKHVKRQPGETSYTRRPDLHEIDIAQFYPGVAGFVISAEALVDVNTRSPILYQPSQDLLQHILIASKQLRVVTSIDDPGFIEQLAHTLQTSVPTWGATTISSTCPINSELNSEYFANLADSMATKPKLLAYVGDLSLRDAVITANYGVHLDWVPPVTSK